MIYALHYTRHCMSVSRWMSKNRTVDMPPDRTIIPDMASFWRTAGRFSALRFLAPGWRVAGFLSIGMALGTGMFVFHVSRAASYLSDSPETCINCHVMTTEYATWRHSSHAGVATCNDCHVPHTSLPAHYAFKAKDGLWHATVFTMRWEPQVIRLSDAVVPVVENIWV